MWKRVGRGGRENSSNRGDRAGNVQLVVEGLLLEDRISVATSCTL